MITKLTSANDSLFASRFEQINAALDKAGVSLSIDSIESYFANLKEIAKLQTDKGEAGKFLLVMPADEPCLEIDANTRIIGIPDHFKKNGVAVTGDNEAELLVFKIDRYFDYKDFMETKIAINWNFTPAGARTPMYENNQVQAGFAKDDELDPGYVLFGFFITKDMTPGRGTLSFAVTCYTESAGSIDYSFNTQTASLAVNEGLTLTDPKEVKNVSNNILGRLNNSAYTEANTTPVVDPVWRKGAIDPEDETRFMGLDEKMNFHMNDDGSEDDVLEIITQAYSDATANMEYTWSAKLADGSADAGSNGREGYFKTLDTSRNERSDYYVMDEGDERKMNKATELEVMDYFDNQAGQLYEKGNVYDATMAGTYSVTAEGTHTIVSGNNSIVNRSNTIASNDCVIPAAAKPEVVLKVKSTLDPEADNFVIEGNDDGYIFVSADKAPEIVATVTSSNDEALGAIAVEAVDENPTDITDFSGYSFVKAPVDGEVQVNADGVTEEGIYRVRAINRRNHTYAVSEPSDEVKTSFVAPELKSINMYCATKEDMSDKVVVLKDGALQDVNLQMSGKKPAYYFVIEQDNSNYNEAVPTYYLEEVDEDGNLQKQDTPADDNLDDVVQIVEQDTLGYRFAITKDDPGMFRIRIDNRYHGTKKVTYSEIFTVLSK